MRNLLTYSLFESTRTDEVLMDLEDIDHILSYLTDFKDLSFLKHTVLRKLPFVDEYVNDIEINIYKEETLFDMDSEIMDVLQKFKYFFRKRYNIRIGVRQKKKGNYLGMSSFYLLGGESIEILKNLVSIKIEMIKI